ncbi:carboxypeptidase S [Auricularia subglabra TFB-10046 SS5]|nr:carboxypeptidase S [Auricularia subglabra TFB-10046 SS5]
MDKLPSTTAQRQQAPRPRWPRRVALVALAATAVWYFAPECHRHRHRHRQPAPATACPQVDALVPSKHANLTSQLDALFITDHFRSSAAELLGGAVRVPTEGYDDMPPVGSDPRWEVFGPFHDYLSSAFPQVHATLALTKVNTYALVYRWLGSDASLKPLLITGHQDVVPVEPETVDQWIHPPFSGHYDGEWIWGRGSVDDKSTVIASLAAIEELIKQGFVPERSVVLAFGFDEESSGEQGALELSKYLEKVYGRKSFALLVDEGNGYTETAGTALVVPAVAEKGYLDAHVTVRTTGGHSSVPPIHTGIGILSALIVELEAHPLALRLTRSHVVYELLQCTAAHIDGAFPPDLRRDILESASSDKALRRVEKVLEKDSTMRALLSTTQAVDIVRGGVKVNALPELVNAVVNYRIDVESSVDALKEHLNGLVEPAARRFGLNFSAWPEDNGESAPAGTLVLSDAWHSKLEPAPRTPTDPAAKPYALLSGTIKAAIQNAKGDPEASVVIAPSISTGNTDTQRYWGLTDHIFRYGHLDARDMYNDAHTINEAIRASGFVNYIRFFGYLILNADEATLD